MAYKTNASGFLVGKPDGNTQLEYRGVGVKIMIN
jgi:hypothetical protein